MGWGGGGRGPKCKDHAHFTSGATRDIDYNFGKGMKQQSLINIQGWTLNLNCSNKKVKTENCHGCFGINSMFRTSVQCLFSDLSRS